jgi:hypothetical protein
VRRGIRAAPLVERKPRALVLEQEPLYVQPPAESGQRAVGTDHAMAREHDGKRVRAVGRADGAGPVAAEPQASRLLAVADRLSVRNGREREPASALEVGPVQREREVELHEFALEVGVELATGLMKDGRPPLRSKLASVEQHALESSVGCDQAEWPDGTVDDCLCHLVNLERAAQAVCEIPPTMAEPALLAQLVEHLHGKEGVDGSSPSEGFGFLPA